MLKLTKNRSSVRLIIFLLVLITATSCLSLRTIPTNRIADLKSRRDILRIHSEDSLWIIDQYNVIDKNLTGKLYSKPGSISNLRAADIYIAPPEAVKIEGNLLKVSTENIGKVDYKIPDAIKILGITGVLLLFLLTISGG